MSIADELKKLEELKHSGALSEAEFEQAKSKLLDSESHPSREHGQSLGKAANRYVTFNMVMGVVGVVIFLILLFTVIIPFFKGMPDVGR